MSTDREKLLALQKDLRDLLNRSIEFEEKLQKTSRLLFNHATELNEIQTGNSQVHNRLLEIGKIISQALDKTEDKPLDFNKPKESNVNEKENG